MKIEANNQIGSVGVIHVINLGKVMWDTLTVYSKTSCSIWHLIEFNCSPSSEIFEIRQTMVRHVWRDQRISHSLHSKLVNQWSTLRNLSSNVDLEGGRKLKACATSFRSVCLIIMVKLEKGRHRQTNRTENIVSSNNHANVGGNNDYRKPC